MNSVCDFCLPSSARILRLEMSLLDCPGKLTDLRYMEDGTTKQTYSDADELAVRKILKRVDMSQAVFADEVERYLALERKYRIAVWGYGSFVSKDMVAELYHEVEKLNSEYQKLRLIVLGEMDSRHQGLKEHQRNLRFNPRIRFGTYILTKELVANPMFQRAVEIACVKQRLQTSMNWLLDI